ncbi:hypothetical protein NCS57_01206600 [Fusarium keratoplasticum]|uniref:Uncharacterized protein n=1 Tax=Fusarium keratoplasticum TaxID=1328300 RepID=A0ACC0QI61_9HYPO|nr:hypothetical protein NCS57_01206600 [Fusarium keratoplasticum]KAI8654600.1 hypothetical protein NCS57_01206600 [Fusarium keratoplasticum]KAI8655460.1 hypothetical protein NCS55_01198100 [Fusarium keratoplasticum]
MTSSIVNTHEYPFHFDNPIRTEQNGKPGELRGVTLHLPNVRGKIPSIQASRMRTMILESYRDPAKIAAHVCTYDGLTSRLAEEAGFPFVFLAGYAVASSYGLPDTGYIALQEVCDKIQEAVRQVSVPVMADGDTGYGSPMNVKRTVESFARAGAAGIMIEDQTWPKRCGHTKGKSVVSRGEAFARMKAAVDARDEGLDIVIQARTDSYNTHGWEEAIYRANKFLEIGVDLVFIEALPDRDTMIRAVKEVKGPLCANIIEGGLTENMSAKDLAAIGMVTVAYPWTLVASHLRSTREALESLKKSFSIGKPEQILSYEEVCYGVGFNKYWALEERYKYDADGLVNGGEKSGPNGASA